MMGEMKRAGEGGNQHEQPVHEEEEDAQRQRNHGSSRLRRFEESWSLMCNLSHLNLVISWRMLILSCKGSLLIHCKAIPLLCSIAAAVKRWMLSFAGLSHFFCCHPPSHSNLSKTISVVVILVYQAASNDLILRLCIVQYCNMGSLPLPMLLLNFCTMLGALSV